VAWYSEGEKTNPADGSLLATTGKVMSGNNTMATVIVSASVGAAVQIQHRDAAAQVTRMGQIIRVLANDTVVVPIGVHPLEPAEGLQVVALGAVIGLVQASIVY
jgi:hypothetical protein